MKMITPAKVLNKANKLTKKSEKSILAAQEVSDEANPDQNPSKLVQKQGAVGHCRPPVEHQFKKGVSANPGGKAVGSRNRLQGDFLRTMAEDFAVHGKAAIIQCRTEKPDVYVKVIASLMPRELEIKQPLDDLSEDELIAGVAALQAFLGKQTDKATQH